VYPFVATLLMRATLRPPGVYMAAAELTSATATTGNFIMVKVGGRI
jgi:hypothetical protein